MTQERIFEIMKQIFTEIIPDLEAENISINDNLKELGANSIDKADIIIELLERAGISVPMIKFGKAGTFYEVIEIIYNEINK